MWSGEIGCGQVRLGLFSRLDLGVLVVFMLAALEMVDC